YNVKTAHPRLLVRDWAAMREKINTSYEAKMMYASIKNFADSCLASDVPEYKQGATGNALAVGREGKKRIMCLAFVYNIEQDKRYLYDAYDEMLLMGEWQDWSAISAYLATGEIMLGFACAVDWLYDGLTQTQRDTIYKILEEKALTVLIHHFEKPEDSPFYNEFNWNSVCTSGALGVALAYADEHPEVCEYIIENCLKYLELIPDSYTADGGYEEGNMYWNLGTAHMVYAIDMLENAFADGFALDEKYNFGDMECFKNTGDFPIYFNGGVGRFNYGDATVGFNDPGVLYWLADRYAKPEYAAYRTRQQKQGSWGAPSHYSLHGLISYNSAQESADATDLPLDKFFKGEGNGFNGISMRSSWENDTALYTAMQGGYNGITHAYLSLGTYVVDYRGERFVKQLGEYNYNVSGTKDTIYYKRAEGNNCLVMNPNAEKDQNRTSVPLVRSGASDNTAFGILDMTSVNDDYVSAYRGLMLTANRNRVLVQDEVKAKAPSEFYWFANTEASVKLAPDGRSALLELGGERMLVRMVKAPADARFELMERMSVVEGVLNTVSSGSKLAIHMQNVTDLELCVEYVGLKSGEGIPAAWNYVPMAQWSAEDTGKTTVQLAGTDVLLKIGSPNAIAKGEKTYVDTNNYEVVPFTENGRTLVPVRFISESFGAKVGWEEATQTVSVSYDAKEIKLVIGSNQMLVNGNAVTLDVPANTYNSRTLIPLRALVEALGKHVFWDDRGLIIISDVPTAYSAEVINRFVTELNVRLFADGKELSFFEADRYAYALDGGICQI
ncbi:MAG: copper amine oxidase N-terminal domain-containing protein, partial [Clostridia bacterium]|nr:copper amine oxidase N-terminal domain-containing protein [Clostridia bacterium]